MLMRISNRRILLLAVVGLFACMPAFGQTSAKPTAPRELCVDEACTPSPTEAPSQGAMKWHPGHYVSFIPSLYPTSNFKESNPTTLAQILTFIDRIAAEPTITGIQVFGYWGEFEGSRPGDYSAGFATMDAILARAALRKKRVMLSIMTTVFGGYGSDWTFAFPAYLVQPQRGGTDAAGTYGISVLNVNMDGLQSRVWQQATSDRLIAMKKAYGARYDSHPNFEMIAIGETSVNLTVGTDGYSFAALDAQLKRQLTEIRKAFPTTAVRLNANFYFSDNNAISLVNHAGNLSISVGGPDVLPKQRIQANQAFTGALSGATDWRGIVPFVAEVQSPSLGGKEGTYTNEQLYLAAMQGVSTASNGATGSGTAEFRAVQPQYFVWYYNTWSGGPEQQWNTGTLPFIRSINGAVHSTACPKGYVRGCRTE